MAAAVTPTEGRPLLELEGASFGYQRKPLLADVSLVVRAGEVLGIVGPNGSGKTTLLRGILGLVRPLAGRVERSARAIGYVPQHEVLDPLYPLSVAEVVQMGAYGRLRGLRRLTPQDRELALTCLHRVGLRDRARRPFASLSGGQRQRVLIARALMVRPELCVLDEPTSGIDALAAQGVMEVVTGLAREEGLAVLLVSHQLDSLRRHVQRAVWVHHGRVEVGPASELLAPERLHELFESPAVAAKER